ncbi:MAG: ATP-binding cassette domain-containing protein, partial [Acholeplasmataceae bacterium]|nr:ATP-binding cassette domain-containing protein [Acholeplasmataceae bacterium]
EMFDEATQETKVIKQSARALKKAALDEVYAYFPVLKERRRQQASTLSGGEQQMLAIGRALMGRPSLLLLDEPSLGLAPLIVKEIFAIIKKIKEQGNTILLVEQNAFQTLKIADYIYVMELGKIKTQGIASDLLQDEQLVKAYLGS